MMDINTTPLIDVMLVLLIMLIITIPIQLHSVKLDMPTGNPPLVPKQSQALRIDIDASSAVRWNGELMTHASELESRMQMLHAQVDQPELHVRPDRNASYAVVAGVMASAQRVGLTKMGIVGSEQFAP
ncbi:biopolymer transporter ExbD [Acidovorax sp. Root402]|uniref:ExbD/TolR family protein n=1 Tax=Acidovorax sp. Root402 TaxID=1736527 RepID=UPI001F39CAD5|nr:biopolymer transporter ExbD [Acidovorax sp. Root402]